MNQTKIDCTDTLLERLKKLAHKNEYIELLKTFRDTPQSEKAKLKNAEEKFEKERLQKLQNITSDWKSLKSPI